MEPLAQQLAQIITAAAQSLLGLLALLVITLAGLAYFFFAKASENARLGVFILLLAGVVGFAVAMFRSAPPTPSSAAVPVPENPARPPGPGTAGAGFDPATRSAPARELLRLAAADAAGVVTDVHYGTGPQRFVGERSVLSDQTARTVAAWEAALSEPTAAGLLRGGPGAEVFAVTGAGFDAAERLDAP